jgi:hypothetical protein
MRLRPRPRYDFWYATSMSLLVLEDAISIAKTRLGNPATRRLRSRFRHLADNVLH